MMTEISEFNHSEGKYFIEVSAKSNDCITLDLPLDVKVYLRHLNVRGYEIYDKSEFRLVGECIDKKVLTIDSSVYISGKFESIRLQKFDEIEFKYCDYSSDWYAIFAVVDLK